MHGLRLEPGWNLPAKWISVINEIQVQMLNFNEESGKTI